MARAILISAIPAEKKNGLLTVVITQSLNNFLRHFGYELRKADSPHKNTSEFITKNEPPPVQPIWPLPHRSGGPSDEEIRREFARHELWHYAYAFEGGLSFSSRHNNPGLLTDAPERPLQRFRHFMPYLIDAEGGTLEGKRVLDIACNSGFWSIQCALLGADVVGFDARPELIEQANFIKSIVGVSNVDFRVMDFWDMNSESLDGTFDVVLNLGILYHLPKPLEALQLTKSMAKKTILLDTALFRSELPLIRLGWEEAFDIRSAKTPGVVANPSKGSIDLMLKHIGAAEWFEIPVRTTDLPPMYRSNKRAAWLIKV